MDITETKQGEVTVIALAGRLDSSTSTQLEQYILPRIVDKARLIVDFSALDYISSAGLRVLLLAAKKVKQADGRLALCALKEHIREVFEISGFLAILDVRPTQADALAGIGA